MPLTEFQVPPIGGVDWRMPIWLERDVTSTTTSKEGIAICDMDDATKIDKAIKDATILQFQPLTDSADVQYTCISGKIHNKNVDTFNNIFHDVWRIFFKTYASVQNNIKRLFAMIAG